MRKSFFIATSCCIGTSLMLILVSCSSPANPEIILTTPSPAGVNTHPIYTSTFMNTITPATDEYEWATRSETTPTLAKVNPTPSMVLISTLTHKEEVNFILNMLNKNGSCVLPCWWGFNLGVTTDEEIFKFYSNSGLPISRREGRLGEENVWKAFNIPESRFYSGVSFGFYKGVLDSIGFSAHISEGDFLIFDDPIYYTYLNRYKLRSLLEDLGKPEGIYVFVSNVSSGNVSPDQEVILFYPAQGVLISYQGSYKEVNGNYSLCLDKTFVAIRLFLPNQFDNFKEPLLEGVSVINEDTMNKYYDSFRTLEESTSMDINSFYTHFMAEDNTCFETPIEVWK